ncbi:hypothetical protein pb186bvf_019454 [Paramecium bursaria]
MNTYSSVKSFESQVQGRKMVEPNLIVLQKDQKKFLSPEPKSNLDQFTENRPKIETKFKKRNVQGQQGKPQPKPKSPLKKTAKKKKVKITKIEKLEKTAIKQTDEKSRRQVLGLDHLSSKQLKKLKSKQKQKQSIVPIPEKKNVPMIKEFMQRKKLKEQYQSQKSKVLKEIDDKRKQENLLKLQQNIKEIFKKCKSDNSHPQTPKVARPKRQITHDEQKKQELQDKYNALSKRYKDIEQSEEQSLVQEEENKGRNYLEEKIFQMLQSSDFVDPSQLNEQEIQILSYHLLNQAATMIQKVWRGFFVRKCILEQLQQMLDDEENELESEKNKNSEDDLVIHDEKKIQQDQYFYNPFGQQQPGEKQVHYSTIKSSIASEDDQKSVLQNSMILHLQQELDSWNTQIESMIQSKDQSQLSVAKQKMQQTIVTIVQQHMKKQASVQKNSERQRSDHSIEQKRLAQETNQESKFNEARKKLSTKNHDSMDERNSHDLSVMNRSSLLSLQSQYLKKENEILLMREDSINLRYRAELKKQIEPEKRKEIDEWYQKEMDDLRKTRLAIEISRKKEASALKKIQRDILIAQNFDDQNPEIMQLQIKVDEQFSSIKQPTKQDNIRIINNFDVYQENEIEQMPETYSEDMYSDKDEQFKNQNIIEQDKQIETYQKVSVLTNDILDEQIKFVAQEILSNKFKYDLVICNLVQQKQQSSGFQTSIDQIQQYIRNFFIFTLENHRNDLINNINIPYGFTAVKRMRLIHGYDDDDDTREDIVVRETDSLAFVLDEQLFLMYEQYRLTESQNDQSYAMKELEHIHNKAIFDACNEALNHFRPYYSNAGIPYPWEKFTKNQRIEFIEPLVRQMENKVIDWAKVYCGFLPIEDESNVSQEKQQIMDEKNQQILIQQLHTLENPLFFDGQTQQFDYLSQIRDERLYKMLISEIKDQEAKWFLFNDDRTEFLMELSDMIFEQLVEEMAAEQID